MGSSYVDSDNNLNWQLVISPTKRINSLGMYLVRYLKKKNFNIITYKVH